MREEGQIIVIMKIEGKEGNKDFTDHKTEDIKDQFLLQLEFNIAKVGSKGIKDVQDNKDHLNFKRELGHNIEIKEDKDRVDLQDVKVDTDSKDRYLRKDKKETIVGDLIREKEEILLKVTENFKDTDKNPKEYNGKNISREDREIDMNREGGTMIGYKEIEKDKAIDIEEKDRKVQGIIHIQE